VLAGASASTLAPISTARSSGFETLLRAPRAAAFVAVEALSASGAVLSTSAPVATQPTAARRSRPAG
jgi:hypothetical protein